MTPRAVRVILIAAILAIGAGPVLAADGVSAPGNAVIAVPTSLNASPADVFSPAAAGQTAPRDASASDALSSAGLYERESPPALIWAALFVAFAKVGKAIFDRRRRADDSTGKMRPLVSNRAARRSATTSPELLIDRVI